MPSSTISEKIRKQLAALPAKPGVYLMRNDKGEEVTACYLIAAVGSLLATYIPQFMASNIYSNRICESFGASLQENWFQ